LLARKARELTAQGDCAVRRSITTSPWLVVIVMVFSFMLGLLGGMPTFLAGLPLVSFLYEQVTLAGLAEPLGAGLGFSSARALSEGAGELAAAGSAWSAPPSNVVAAIRPPTTTTAATTAPMRAFRLVLGGACSARCACRSLCSRASWLWRSSPLTAMSSRITVA
jgi:hypothetical protein